MNNQMEFSKELKGKKILHVLDRSIPNLSGYSIRSKYIIEFQRQQGLSPCVVSSPVYEHKPSFEIINEIEYHRAYEPLTGIQKQLISIPFVGQKLIMKQFEKKIDQVVKDKQIDLIHAHSPSLCGIGITLLTAHYGISMGDSAEFMAQYGMPERLYPKLTALSVAIGPLLIFLVTLFTALIPVLRIPNLHPVEALRS